MNAASRYMCERPGAVVYCDGLGPYDECSDLWYPSEMRGIRLVTFEGRSYACQLVGKACLSYTGGPPPVSFYSPDIWCDGLLCSKHDPDEWLEVSFDFADYFCEESFLGFQQFDCYQSLTGSPPTYTALDPDLYCSGPELFLTCSPDWYPDELEGYDFITFAGSDYLCEPALLGSWGDFDCGYYAGGDPAYVYTGDLKCSDMGYSFECDYDFYPSELDGVTFSTIGGYDYVCRSSYGGSECFRYYGGSPTSAMYGLPDLYCNYAGLCDPYGYP